jgi:hypothetical protein
MKKILIIKKGSCTLVESINEATRRSKLANRTVRKLIENGKACKGFSFDEWLYNQEAEKCSPKGL